MNEYGLEENAFINSLVGEGTTFNGEITLDGLLRIDGDYLGTITTPGTVLVGKSGRAESTIHAGTIVIGGIVKGNIFSTEKVVILSTGLLIGNITAPRLIVEEGVLLHGNCVIQKKPADQETSPEEPGSAESGEKPEEKAADLEHTWKPQEV
ncbi:MAG: polymer-forming cytoskeletal protein [Spirochaetales bacterium]|nr:polymer-forming cytoskeletal protein [Spirochaetales bacterium]